MDRLPTSLDLIRVRVGHWSALLRWVRWPDHRAIRGIRCRGPVGAWRCWYADLTGRTWRIWAQLEWTSSFFLRDLPYIECYVFHVGLGLTLPPSRAGLWSRR